MFSTSLLHNFAQGGRRGEQAGRSADGPTDHNRIDNDYDRTTERKKHKNQIIGFLEKEMEHSVINWIFFLKRLQLLTIFARYVFFGSIHLVQCFLLILLHAATITPIFLFNDMFLYLSRYPYLVFCTHLYISPL